MRYPRLFSSLFVSLLALMVLLPSVNVYAEAKTLRTAWQFDGAEPRKSLLKLDPATAHAEKNIVILVDLFEPLAYSAFDGLKPGGAKQWKFSDDGKSIIFSLDPDKHWSDGKPVTAHDYVFAYQRLAKPEIAERVLGFVRAAIVGLALDDDRPVGVSAPDDHTLVVQLTAPYAMDIATFSHPMLFALPRHALENDKLTTAWASWKKPLSNGPYQLAGIEDGVVKISKNPHFKFKDSKALFENVEHYHISWADTAEQFLEKRIDLINRVPPKQYPWMNKQQHKKHFASINSIFLAMNAKHEPLQDARVRKALGLAIDRDSLAKGFDGNFGKAAYGLVPDGYVGYKAQQPGLPVKEAFAKAKRLMEEAGYSDEKRLALTFTTDRHESYQRLYNAVASNWVNIYVDLKLEFVDTYSQHWGKLLEGNYQISRRGWNPDFSSPRAYLNACEGKGELSICGYFNNPEFNKLLAESAKTGNHEEKLALFKQAENLLLQADVVIPLMQRDYPVLVSEKVDIAGLEPHSRPRSVLIRAQQTQP